MFYHIILHYNKDELKQTFISIITKGRKNNTYKFALAKFLLDQCNKLNATDINNYVTNDQSMIIDYKEIADAFLTYYWHQECKYKIRQNFHEDPPRVIKIIRKKFGEEYNPKRFKDMPKDKIYEAQNEIKKNIFGAEERDTSNVIPRFQNIMRGNTTESKKIFYTYDDSDSKLELKPQAVKFFNENYTFLIKATILEWCKFLEKINTLPRLIAKIESYEIKRGSLQRYITIFREFKTCFYCNSSLDTNSQVHVDHFIPWSYIFEDECWNLVLSCDKCNLKKSDSLANESFLKEIIIRNKTYGKKIISLRHSISKIDVGKGGWENEIKQHYKNCQEYGFNIKNTI